jgi:hypothetical protein
MSCGTDRPRIPNSVPNMERRSSPHRHSLACLILHCAVNVLDSGLLCQLDEIVEARRSRVTSSSLCSLVAAAMWKLWPQLSKTMKSMAARYGCSMSVSDVESLGKMNVSSDAGATSFHDCTEKIGVFGRSCVTSRGLGRGHLLMREYPFAVCCKQSCTCRHDVYLAEHILLTILLYSNLRSGGCHRGVKSRESDLKLDAFFSTLQSKLGSELQPSPISQDLDTWSYRQQCLMFTIGCLIELAVSDTATLDKSSSSWFEKFKVSHEEKPSSELANRAWLVVNILARLPTNTHAITRVVFSRRTGSESQRPNDADVEQEIAGYGVYLCTSCVNHSCDPNATIRFQFADSSGTDNISLLSTAACEIVALKSIHSLLEVTVSYGPLAGRDPLKFRKSVLQKQYLFSCMCEACERETLQAESDAGGTSPEQYVGGNEENASLLNDLVAKVPVLNVQVTETLNLFHRCNNEGKAQGLLRNLCREHINPIMLELLEVRSQTFGIPFPRHICELRNELHAHTDQYCVSSVSASVDELNNYSTLIPRISQHDGPAVSSPPTQLFKEWSTAYCCTLDMQAHVLALQHEYKPAANCVREAIFHMLLAQTYSVYDVAIARERTKLAGLLVSCGRILEARSEASKALDILVVSTNTGDIDYVESLRILEFTGR